MSDVRRRLERSTVRHENDASPACDDQRSVYLPNWPDARLARRLAVQLARPILFPIAVLFRVAGLGKFLWRFSAVSIMHADVVSKFVFCPARVSKIRRNFRRVSSTKLILTVHSGLDPWTSWPATIRSVYLTL